MSPDSCQFLTSLIIIALAFLIDLLFGEPPDPVHPTVWMGKLIASLKPKAKGGNPKAEKFKGLLLCLFVTASFAFPAYVILHLVRQFLGLWAYTVFAAVMLKMTFSVRGLSYYTMPIARAIESGRVDEAKRWLPFIVRRNPEALSQSQIISAAVESIAESTVDGITSPLFYFALFGVPGAIAFRAINTLDSMVGYKDREHVNIGWFSARIDTFANYVPARLTALLMVLASAILRKNWRASWRVLRRDKSRTESLNAGWPMSAMAGALGVQLEKPGFYRLGEAGTVELSPMHIPQALCVMKTAVLLFAFFVILPIIALWACLGI
ncbi:MAG: cobalamin biosynthesis protein [Nitrososphaerota archaeon]|nr:cobalamin biosynthesis protein [Candidatus Bathyarchaeota archaeon]MDW8193558.1 cobalamin biosynthesis protein [Nitrososphaerota archaeon]